MLSNEFVIDPKMLSAWDEARNYDAASSYNFLNAELRKVRSALGAGKVVRVDEPSGSVVLATANEFDVWATRRYPHATHG